MKRAKHQKTRLRVPVATVVVAGSPPSARGRGRGLTAPRAQSRRTSRSPGHTVHLEDRSDEDSHSSHGMVSYVLSDLAYTKIIVHAFKHPHARVNGVLLGTIEGKEVEVTDAVPLLHHWTSLSPMMEIGLDMVRRCVLFPRMAKNGFARQAKTHAAECDLSVVGYYEASEFIDEGAAVLGKVGERVTGKLREGFDSALAVVVRSSILRTMC
jgi:hypothetical protein